MSEVTAPALTPKEVILPDAASDGEISGMTAFLIIVAIVAVAGIIGYGIARYRAKERPNNVRDISPKVD